MTEVLTRTSVSESFSYSHTKPEFEPVQTEKDSDMLISNEIEDESTLSFNSKSDVACDKSSENTICGSDDSIISEMHTSKNSADMANNAQDSSNSTIKSDTSFEDYEYMTTETTVINTTYSISQTGVHSIKVVKDGQHTDSQSNKNDIDNQRVVVQILSSDKDSNKSNGMFENKSAPENQSTHCFRDDVCKLLTKPGPTLDYGSDTVEEKEFKDVLNVPSSSIQTVSSIGGSLQIVRSQRRRGLNPFLLSDKGPKFCEIKNVSKHLKAASANALRVLHFMLYNKYGLCGTEMKVSRTRRRILHFSGYPFDDKSTYYQKKFRTLLKIPFQVLLEIHEALFGKHVALGRFHMINNLMAVFSDTSKYNEIINCLEPNIKLIPEHEYTALKKKAKSGPLPVVMLKKLPLNDLTHVKQLKTEETCKNVEMKNEVPADKMVEKSPYAKPAYILEGPGVKLKNFPMIVRNVNNAKKEDLKLLHHLLYGRVETTAVCRRNILEFSGFLECQNEYISKVQDNLIRLDQSDMFELCKILCLRARTNSRIVRIQKIMKYLKAPFNPLKIKGIRRNVSTKKPPGLKLGFSRSRIPRNRLELWDEPENAECDDGGYKLRDFRRICSNIECSAPPDLTELNDLLFMKPSDDTEIHDKILNFTRFGFSESSIHYHYRKTLMFYMGPCIVLKIAKLLDIENRHFISSHEDLSGCILNFLMEKKGPGSPCAKSLVAPSFSKSVYTMDESKMPENIIPIETIQAQNHTITSHQENVFISRVSTSSEFADLGSPSDNEYLLAASEKRYDSFLPSVCNEDNSVPLRDFIHHPTDQELKCDIDAIVKNGLFAITLGDVVQKVYQLYPRFNLTYRENFIKSETRKIVSELRQNAVDHMKQSSNN